MTELLSSFEQFYGNQLLSRTEVPSVVVPAAMIVTWYVTSAVKQADESHDKWECRYDFYRSNF